MTTLEADEWRDGGEKRERRWNWEKRFFFFCPFLLDFARDDFEKNDARSTSSTSTSLVSLDLNLDHHHHKKKDALPGRPRRLLDLPGLLMGRDQSRVRIAARG